MPSIWKKFSRVQATPYEFPDASELKVDLPELEEEKAEGEEASEKKAPAVPVLDPQEPISYAKIQADAILQEARREADEILERARKEAAEEAEAIRAAAREDGRREGRAEGMAQAMEEGRQRQEKQAAAMEAEVQRFLDKAGAALDRQMDQNVNDLRDLALAIAEKVVCVSLKSSGEVVSRMIQTAVDKRKRREWVHIYIAECDAKRMGQIPASLTAALSSLSDRVRIIPMANDESGTCIIEMPDEIIDASTNTQLGNIRTLLMDAPSVGGGISLF